jgi:GNAT superfamily N-acetyltransferase
VGEPAVGYALCYSTYSTWEGEGLYIGARHARVRLCVLSCRLFRVFGSQPRNVALRLTLRDLPRPDRCPSAAHRADDLYVREAQRGRQMGTALVHGCVRRALDTGCQRLQWQALDWNARALEFYTRCVGAVERVEASGARYVNLIMRPDAMAAFCDRQAARRGGEQARGATTAGGAAAAPSPVAAPAGSQTLDAV